jgi:hypothetical protein
MNRRIRVRLRLSVEEDEQLRAAASSASTSLSSLIRERAFAQLPPGVEPAPLVSVPRGLLTSSLRIRLTPTEGKGPAERALECGLTVSAYVRCVVRGRTPAPHRPEARAAVVALSRIGNNLGQLDRLPLPPDLALAVKTLLGEVYQVRNEILEGGMSTLRGGGSGASAVLLLRGSIPAAPLSGDSRTAKGLRVRRRHRGRRATRSQYGSLRVLQGRTEEAQCVGTTTAKLRHESTMTYEQSFR